MFLWGRAPREPKPVEKAAASGSDRTELRRLWTGIPSDHSITAALQCIPVLTQRMDTCYGMCRPQFHVLHKSSDPPCDAREAPLEAPVVPRETGACRSLRLCSRLLAEPPRKPRPHPYPGPAPQATPLSGPTSWRLTPPHSARPSRSTPG